MKPVSILGVAVDPVTCGQAVERIAAAVRDRRRLQVVTVNPEFVIQSQRDPAFRAVLDAAGLAVADGVGITAGARVLRQRLPGRVTGVDLVEALAARAAADGFGLFLLGAAPGVAAAAAEALKGRQPGLVTETYAGSPAALDYPAIAERVRAARPGALLVAFGAPRQDLWIAEHLDDLGVPVGLGVGGTFDYLAGVVPRAPALVRRAGLEWSYRLWREPARWRRMLRLPDYAWQVLLARPRR